MSQIVDLKMMGGVSPNDSKQYSSKDNSISAFFRTTVEDTPTKKNSTASEIGFGYNMGKKELSMEGEIKSQSLKDP